MTVKAVTGNGNHDFVPVPLEVDESVHANHRYQSFKIPSFKQQKSKAAKV